MDDGDLIIFSDDAIQHAVDAFVGWWLLASYKDASQILPMITDIREREPAVFKRAMAQAIRAFLRTYKGR